MRNLSANLSRPEKERLLHIVREKKRRLREGLGVYHPNEGQAPVHLSEKVLRCVFSGNGGGKCLDAATILITHEGREVRAGDVAVGDLLMGPDSRPRTVTALGSGEQPMYEIAPTDGSGIAYTVNEDHILSLQYCSKDGRYGLKQGEVVDVTVKDYLKWSPRKRRLFYGYRAAIEFEGKDVPIDPYFLGCWLGDGHSATLGITTMDTVIATAVTNTAASLGATVREESKNTGLATSYFLSNCLKFRATLLYSLHLKNNKHIPEIYKINDRETRLRLLAGLIDTDGHLSKSTHYEIIQVNKRLADDITWLARSLGFKVHQRPKWINGVCYHRMSILGDIWKIPVQLPHKKATPYKKQRNPLRYKIEVTPKGIGKYVGFTLKEDPYFLLSDFTVTHNTALAANEVLWHAAGYNPQTGAFNRVPARVVVLLDHPEKVADVWLPELRKWTNITEKQLHKRGKPYVTQITFPNGSEILFMFHQQEPMLFESIELDFLVADEPPPRHVYVALRRGGRKKGRKAKYLIVGTPISCSWMRIEILDPWKNGEKKSKNVECFTFGTTANEANLAEGYIEEFSSVLTEKEKRIRLQGEFYDLSGLALAHLFKRESHIIDPIEWDQSWPVVIAIDPHTAKPHHACLVGVDPDGNLHYMAEFKEKMLAREMAKELLLDWWSPHTIWDTVCDSLGSSEYTGGENFKSFIQVCKEEGLPVRATTWLEKNDEDFIGRIRDVLRIDTETSLPHLFIWRGNDGIIRDIENVAFQKIKNIDDYKDKLDIEHKDFLACLKYALSTNLRYEKTRRKPVSRLKKGRNPMGTTITKTPPRKRRLSLRKKFRHLTQDEFGDDRTPASYKKHQIKYKN